MEQTSKQTKFWIITTDFFWTILSVISSNFYNFAYFFMILSMYWNAGLISLFFPIAVFGYALLEEKRPSKNFWTLMTVYTMMVLLIKFTF